MHSGAKKRIVILGGGTGALFAALALTSLPKAKEHYSITIYQMGWRLGGKGASGRREDQAFRVEEHGLHVWSGFYDNAIRRFKDCLNDLGDEPYVYNSFEDAFIANNNIALVEHLNGKWVPWRLEPPNNDAVPGKGGVTLSPLQYLRMLTAFLKSYSTSEVFDQGWTTHAPHGYGGILAATEEEPDVQPDVFARVDTLVKALPDTEKDHDPEHLHQIQVEARNAQMQIARYQEPLSVDRRDDDDLRRALMVLDLGVAALYGLVADGVMWHGFEAIDDDEASAWLIRNGAAPASVDGALVRAIYSYAFGFSDGVAKRAHRSISAGVFVKGVFRLVFTYKGSIFFKMRAGMGDTIFSPIYKLLKKRGVKFKFFHRVEQLGLDAAGRHVETIQLAQQASLKAEDYDPFVRVKELDCWPSEPNWEQLKNGKELKASGVNFESAWAPQENYQALPPLRRGHDFDDVILGISLAALPHVAKPLIDASPAWQQMVDQVRTTRTQSFQLWFKRSAEELGWPHGKTIMTAYAPQTDTWANMSNLCSVEDWPKRKEPKSIAYFCGPMLDPARPPGFGDTGYPEEIHKQTRDHALDWITKYGKLIFPNAFDAKGNFNFNELVDVQASKGEALWKNQYFRGNIDPTETYVLSVPGATNARLPSDRSGYANLFLAGDWTYTGMNAGCIEAAVMSGLRAASGLSGHKFEIVGEEDGFGMSEPDQAVPVLQTTRAQNSPWPWSVAYGMADTTGPTILVPVPADIVRGMLPGGLALRHQTITPAGTHPVIFLFARQRDVRPNVSPWGVNYLEFTTAVPWVGPADETQLPPLICPTRLYLNNRSMIMLGRYGYGFPKYRASMEMGDTFYIVRDVDTNAEIISCRYELIGKPVRADDISYFGRVRSGYEQSMINQNIFGKWQYAKYDFSLGQALLQPASIQIRISSNVFKLPLGSFSLPPITKSPFGGFFLNSAATINNPFQSLQIKNTLRKLAK